MKLRINKLLISICVTYLVLGCACKNHNRPAYQVDMIIRKELILSFSFPDKNLENEGYFLASPRYVEDDGSGNIFVSDQSLNKILIFNTKGKYLYQFGGKGQGPGDFDTPSDLAVTHEYILVKENNRFQYLDRLGKHLKSFNDFKGYYKIALRKDGLIYALPILRNAATKLIDVLSPEGRIVSSFGNCIEFKRDLAALNFCDMEVYGNSLYIAFRHFPIVRKYAENGVLVKEYKITYGSMSEMEKSNLESYEAHLQGKRRPFTSIISNVDTTKEGFYLMYGDESKIEILKYDYEGNMKATYWFARPDGYYADEFLVIEDAGKDIFYVLQISPESKIDIFRPKI